MAGIGQRRIAVEHAASHVAGVLRQARREGTARDCSGVCSGVFVCHTARVLEGTIADSAVVCHLARALEGTTADGAVVCHCFIRVEGSSIDFSSGVVCHIAHEDAVRDCSYGVVCHTARALEGAARDRSSGPVCHVCCKVAAGNFCTPFNLNLAHHSRSGLRSGLVLGMGETEIIRSARQSQSAGVCRVRRVFSVLPAGAGILVLCLSVAIRERRFLHIGGVRQTVRAHDEFWEGVFCKGPQGEHGEHHAQCQDQAENAFFHWGRPPFLPKTASKSRTVVRFWVHHTIKTTGREAKPREMH